jgi:hypothetical protein
MRATISGLAALLVSTLTLNAALAQTPYPVTPVGYPGPGAYPAGYGAPVNGTTTDGGCDCDGGKHHLLGRLGLKHKDGCDGCGKSGGCDDGKCGRLCAAFKGWLCRPYPSNAPSCRPLQYPLGFPNHPYVRSPRDFFMFDDP